MWLLLVEAGFVGFVVSLFAIAWKGFDSSGKATPAVWRWVLAAACFLAIWLIALPRIPSPDEAIEQEYRQRRRRPAGR